MYPSTARSDLGPPSKRSRRAWPQLPGRTSSYWPKSVQRSVECRRESRSRRVGIGGGAGGTPRILFPLPERACLKSPFSPREKVRACPECTEGMRGVPTKGGRCIRIPTAFRPAVGPRSPESSPIKGEEHRASLPNRVLRQARKGRGIQGDGSVYGGSRVRPQYGPDIMRGFPQSGIS